MYKWERRERKKRKDNKYSMRVSGRSVFLIERIVGEKAKKAKLGLDKNDSKQ
jgi:hypothetical protein